MVYLESHLISAYLKKIVRYTTLLILLSILFFQQLNAQDNIEKELNNIYLISINHCDSALMVLDELYNKEKRNLNDWSLGAIFEAYARIHEEKEDNQLALEYYFQAKEKYESVDSFATAATLYSDIGVIYFWMGELEKATEAYMEGVKTAEQFNDIASMARCYQNMGMLYGAIEDNNLTLKYYNKALELSRKISGFESNEAGILQNIGIYYSNQGELDSAINNYKQSLSIFEELDETVNMAITYNNLGVLYEKMNLSDSTLAYYKKALNIFYQIDFKRGISISLYNIGQIYRRKGNYKLARDYIYKSQEIAEKIKLREQIQSNYYELSWIYEEEKNYEKSLEYMILAYDWRDTLYTIEQAKQIAEFEAVYESEQKEKEILELEKRREKVKTYMIILAGSLILLITLIIFLLIFYKLKEKTAIQKALSREQTKHFKAVIEAQEEERKRLAGELHDSVGPLLSVTQLYISDLAETSKNNLAEEQALFDKSLQILGEACNETRNISHNLMPGVLIRSGLISAIRELTNKVKDSNQYIINFDTNEIKQRFEETIEITNYRIFQELLNNIIKHSGATEISIKIKTHQNKLLITVKDNGTGFDTDKINESPGIGWKSIYSRLSLINGNVKIDSNANGTVVLVTTPIS